jgi:hypothetical protein
MNRGRGYVPIEIPEPPNVVFWRFFEFGQRIRADNDFSQFGENRRGYNGLRSVSGIGNFHGYAV